MDETLPALRAGRVLVLWARPVERPRLLTLLDGDERSRHDRLYRPADRARFTAAHALARVAIGQLRGRPPASVRLRRTCVLCGGEHGKPQPYEPGLTLSLSHSGDRVVVALGAGDPVGVDVERLVAVPDVELLARLALAPAERQPVRAAPEDRRSALVLTSWCRKEAALKATGHGLTADLTHVEVSAGNDPAKVARWTGSSAPRSPVHLHDLDVGAGYVAAVAVLRAVAPVVVQRGADELLREF